MDTLRRQLATADALDAKAWQALGAGSVILALGVVGDLGGLVLVLPLAGYVCVAVGSFFCLRVRRFEVMPSTTGLWQDNWFRPVADLDHTVIYALVTAEATNRAILHDKARDLRVALVGLAIETAALVLVALF